MTELHDLRELELAAANSLSELARDALLARERDLSAMARDALLASHRPR